MRSIYYRAQYWLPLSKFTMVILQLPQCFLPWLYHAFTIVYHCLPCFFSMCFAIPLWASPCFHYAFAILKFYKDSVSTQYYTVLTALALRCSKPSSIYHTTALYWMCWLSYPQGYVSGVETHTVFVPCIAPLTFKQSLWATLCLPFPKNPQDGKTLKLETWYTNQEVNAHNCVVTHRRGELDRSDIPTL